MSWHWEGKKWLCSYIEYPLLSFQHIINFVLVFPVQWTETLRWQESPKTGKCWGVSQIGSRASVYDNLTASSRLADVFTFIDSQQSDSKDQGSKQTSLTALVMGSKVVERWQEVHPPHYPLLQWCHFLHPKLSFCRVQLAVCQLSIIYCHVGGPHSNNGLKKHSLIIALFSTTKIYHTPRNQCCRKNHRGLWPKVPFWSSFLSVNILICWKSMTLHLMTSNSLYICNV